MKSRLVRSVLAAFGLFVIQALAATLLRLSEAPPQSGGLAAIVAANLLTASVLTGLASRLRLDRPRRWLLLFGAPCAIAFSSLAEAALFSLTSLGPSIPASS